MRGRRRNNLTSPVLGVDEVRVLRLFQSSRSSTLPGGPVEDQADELELLRPLLLLKDLEPRARGGGVSLIYCNSLPLDPDFVS